MVVFYKVVIGHVAPARATQGKFIPKIINPQAHFRGEEKIALLVLDLIIGC